MNEPVYVEIEGAVATLVLNRPDKLNAMGLAQWIQIGELVDELHQNDSIRCLILRGVDERAFSAGADIAEFESERNSPEQVRAYGESLDTTLTAIKRCQHPVIAAIRGVCVGGGLEMASACDLRICSDTGRFGAPINRLGLTMSYAEVKTLKDLAGTAGALEVLLGGGVFDAQRAYELSLVNQVTADSELLDTSYSLARRIAERAPLVNRWHKKFIRRLSDPTPLTAEELDEGFAAYNTEDYRIGYEAFLAKKKPDFKGR
ncbi:MAG: enoyl-CoA hydratase/isomerase family protein [Candidatus Rariloculaceae bacterium]